MGGEHRFVIQGNLSGMPVWIVGELVILIVPSLKGSAAAWLRSWAVLAPSVTNTEDRHSISNVIEQFSIHRT